MIVYYQTLLYHEHHNLLVHHNEGGLKGYKFAGCNPCCKEMESAMDKESKLIIFGNDEYDIKDLNLNFVNGRSMGKSGTEYTFTPIKFCPFCGEHVELKEQTEIYVNKPSES